ncbi:MAG: hypothetical protein WCR19_04710 [Acholeplasmataceae bacterium]
MKNITKIIKKEFNTRNNTPNLYYEIKSKIPFTEQLNETHNKKFAYLLYSLCFVSISSFIISSVTLVRINIELGGLNNQQSTHFLIYAIIFVCVISLFAVISLILLLFNFKKYFKDK